MCVCPFILDNFNVLDLLHLIKLEVSLIEKSAED